jgi:hypothetical protein
MNFFLRFLLTVWTTFAMSLCCTAQQTNQPSLSTNSLYNKALIRSMKIKLQKDSPHLSAEERTHREMWIKLYEIQECNDYLEQISSRISKTISACDSSSSPSDTIINAKFLLHQDGSISDITISGNTNAPIAQCVMQAIKSSSSSQKWPDKMRSIVGKDVLEWGHLFGFNMTPPAPN